MNSNFIRNVVVMISGNAIAMALPILCYPVLSRIFTPADYALFGLYFSVFSFLEIGSAGRYDFAVMLPEKDDDAINVVAGGLIFSLVYSLIIFVLVIFIRDWVAARLNNSGLSNWLFFVPLGLLLISISKLFNNWLIRQKKFKASSFNKASQKLAETSTQTAFGFFRVGNGLVLGDVVGRLFNAIFSFYQGTQAGFDKGKISKEAIRSVLIQYIKFPKYNILPSMLNALSGMLPVFIVSSHFDVNVSGSFNFSRIILSVPFALIAAGISQVLMQQIAERRHKSQPVAKELSSLATKLGILSIVGVVILYFWAPFLFEIFFGAKWRLSGEYTSILIISYAISFVVSPFSILLAVFDKIKYSSIWQTFYFVGSCTLWFFRNLSIEEFLTALVIVDIVAYIACGIIIYKVVKGYEQSIEQS